MKQIRCLIAIILLFPAVWLQTLAGQTTNVDSLENIVKTGNTKARLKALDKLSFAFLYSDIGKSFEYAGKQYQLAKKAQDIDKQGLALYNLAMAHNYSGNADSSLYYFDAAYKLFEQTGNEKELAVLRVDRSGVKVQKFRYEEALGDLYKSRDYYEQIGDKSYFPLIFLRIGSIYFYSLGDYDMAEKYFREGLEMEEQLGTDDYKGSNMGNLATVKAAKREFNQAIDYCKRSIENFRKNGNSFNTGRMLYIMGEILMEAGREKENVIGFLNEAMDIAEQTDNQSLKEEVMRGRTEYYLKIKDILRAQKEAEAALALADTSSYTIMSAYKYLFTRIAVYRQNPDEALLQLKDYLFYLEKEQSEETANKITEMEVKYETEKKEIRITDLEKEKILYRWLGLAGAAVLLLAIGLLFYRHRLNVHKRRLSEQKVKQLEQEKQLVATQSVIDGETQERTRLARDLHDGLGGMLSAVKLNLKGMQKSVVLEYADVQLFDKAMGMLDDSIRELRRVAHNMMPDSLSRFGLKPAIADFCGSIPIVKFIYFGDETRLDQKLEVMIYRTVHELVNNALKHAEATRILVQIIQEPERIALTVEDNGRGFDLAAETKGTGLTNIRTRVASYNGSLVVDSKPGEGTEINAELRII
jgi:signal transduction histidine kinase